MSTIKIFIYSTDTQCAELNFLSEKLNWGSLVLVITSTELSIDSPLILFYRLSGSVHSLENQTQFLTLLSTSPNELKLYLQQDDVKKDVFEQPPPFESAFTRLGKLLEAHKPIIGSHKTLSRCVGILASAIAMDTNNRDFDKEFKALVKVIEAQRLNHDVDEEGLEHEFGYYCHGRGAGRGGGTARGDFGGSSRGFGRGFMFGGRGAYHHHQRREEYHSGGENSSTEEE